MSRKEKSWPNRLFCYFLGLFIMTIAIAISVKSDLGVSPISSIPYTMTRCWGIEMGKATILLHMSFVLIQMILLGKEFKGKMFLQIPVGIIFGYFTTFCNYLMTFLPDTDNIVLRLIMVLISVVLIAVGIFIYMPADIILLAGEGTIQAISYRFGWSFHKVKIVFDVTMVTISLITCLVLIHSFGSVGIGTVIAAVLVGVVLGQIKRCWNKYIGV